MLTHCQSYNQSGEKLWETTATTFLFLCGISDSHHNIEAWSWIIDGSSCWTRFSSFPASSDDTVVLWLALSAFVCHLVLFIPLYSNKYHLKEIYDLTELQSQQMHPKSWPWRRTKVTLTEETSSRNRLGMNS